MISRRSLFGFLAAVPFASLAKAEPSKAADMLLPVKGEKIDVWIRPQPAIIRDELKKLIHKMNATVRAGHLADQETPPEVPY